MKIIYLSPVSTVPVGGIKVLYKHSELLSKLGFDSCVYHPKKPKFQCGWFAHEAIMDRTPLKKHFITQQKNYLPYFKQLDKKNAFVVIPEIWAAKFAPYCIKENIKYAIYVQNGYLINTELTQEKKFPYETLKQAYENASLLMSISDNTTEMIKIAFPTLEKQKIIRLLPHVSTAFQPSIKEKTITYMPRRLPEHSQKMCFYLKNQLPTGWQLKPIHNMNEQETAKALGASSIFMSFSDQEGCPLPPLEACFTGNLVIGYTGQGANEYFATPNFIKINNGDFKTFTEAIISGIRQIENGLFEEPEFIETINGLKLKYGEQNEKAFLLLFANQLNRL